MLTKFTVSPNFPFTWHAKIHMLSNLPRFDEKRVTSYHLELPSPYSLALGIYCPKTKEG